MIPDVTSSIGALVATAVLAYLAGAVSFGLLSARLFALGDLRAVGSGNTGATNVLRTGNRAAAVLTLVGDAGKGAAAVVAARAVFGPDAAQVAALAALVGHCFPVWHGFRGGKGVATFLGTLGALAPAVGLASCAAWLVVAGVFRISSLGALAAAALAPLWALAFGRPEATALCAALAGLVFWRHVVNIRRLAAGTEPRIGKG